ncbi:MAG: hypothetical protein OXC05_10165 [Halieaceae bacterium]|nr:hypothetical protein [Halieaceae bacterium]
MAEVQNRCVPGKVYISGWAALNMRDGTDNSGDWHPLQVLPDMIEYAGEGCEINTLPWLGEKGVLAYPDRDSLLDSCPSRRYWDSFPPPYLVANHKRAAVDLLYHDFIVLPHIRGRSVDIYAWMDKDEDIQEILDDFQIIIDALADTPQAVNPEHWRDYKKMIWKNAA